MRRLGRSECELWWGIGAQAGDEQGPAASRKRHWPPEPEAKAGLCGQGRSRDRCLPAQTGDEGECQPMGVPDSPAQLSVPTHPLVHLPTARSPGWVTRTPATKAGARLRSEGHDMVWCDGEDGRDAVRPSR